MARTKTNNVVLIKKLKTQFEAKIINIMRNAHCSFMGITTGENFA